MEGATLGGTGQGRVLLLPRRCCVGQGCSELPVTPGIFQTGCFKEKNKAGISIKIRSFPESVFSVSNSRGREREERKGEVEEELLSFNKSLRLLSCNFE